MGWITEFFIELRRRRVFRVAALYVVGGWVAVQVASEAFPALDVPDTAIRYVWTAVFLGLPLALIFGWRYDLTAKGIVRTPPGNTSQVADMHLDRADYIILGLLAVIVGSITYGLIGKILETETPQRRVAQVNDIPPKSIAVLPFENMSADTEATKFFVSGVHSDLITQLTKLGSLDRVIARSSVMKYRDEPEELSKVGVQLGVATVLLGDVQHAGKALHINVNLAEAESGATLWAETYDRQLTAANVFSIQGEIATAIALALRATLSPEETSQLNQIPTENLEAYDFYLTGNDFAERPSTRQTLQTAQQMYERAIELDPDFAQAWANLAYVHSQNYFYGYRTEARLEQSRDALEHARTLNPNVPEVHLATGYYHYHGFHDYDTALQEFAKAEALLPGDARVNAAQGYIERRLGLWSKSLASLERAIVLDPRNADLIQGQAGTLERLGRYTEAKRYYDRAQMLAPDSSIIKFKKASLVYNASGDTSALRDFTIQNPGSLGQFSDYARWWVEFLDGDYKAALDALKSWQEDVFSFQIKFFPRSLLEGLSYQYVGDADAARVAYESALAYLQREAPLPSDERRIMVAYGMVYAGLGNREAAIDAGRRAAELVAGANELLQSPWYEQDIVLVYSMAGNQDLAIEQLGEYLSEPSNTTLTALRADPRIEQLESHPGFQALVDKYDRK